MARFNLPIIQLVNGDASGVASGWKLNFYSTGTTTRKDTFSDSTLTTANANPVVADSAGRFDDIFMEAGTYKVVLTDENDVEIWSADPVDGATGNSGSVEAKTADYTMSIDDITKLMAFNATSAAITFTLLDAATAGNGAEITVKKTDSSVNAVTVDGNGSETIDGAASYALTQQHQSVTLRCDGSNWQIKSFGLALADLRLTQDFLMPRNLALAASVASNALTISLKGWNGGDPSTANPVVVPFRSATAATGTATALTVTAATSLVVSSGSELGVAASTPFRLWVVAFNDGGTFRLGVIKTLGSIGVYRLRDDVLESATAEGGAGAADSARTIYAGAAVTTKPMRLLGYMDWDSGLSTPGTWDAGPDRIQLFHPGLDLPGAEIVTRGTAQATTSGTAFNYTSLPAGIDEIVLSFEEVSLSGTDSILVQIGDSGGLETSGYVATGGIDGSFTSSTAGFPVRLANAANIFSGQMILTRIDGNTWISSHAGKLLTTNSNFGGGSKTLSAELTQLTITRTGTDTFDGGKVNIVHKRPST